MTNKKTSKGGSYDFCKSASNFYNRLTQQVRFGENVKTIDRSRNFGITF